MEGLYPKDKVVVLVNKRTKQGWFVDDEDFPDDTSERAYWVRLKRTFAKEQIDSERSRLHMESEVNEDSAAAEETGKLFGESMPVLGMSAGQSEDFWKSMLGLDSKALAKGKAKKKQRGRLSAAATAAAGAAADQQQPQQQQQDQ